MQAEDADDTLHWKYEKMMQRRAKREKMVSIVERKIKTNFFLVPRLRHTITSCFHPAHKVVVTQWIFCRHFCQTL